LVFAELPPRSGLGNDTSNNKTEDSRSGIRSAEINRADKTLESELAARRQSAEQLARQLTL
jgi:hypothetical protein